MTSKETAVRIYRPIPAVLCWAIRHQAYVPSSRRERSHSERETRRDIPEVCGYIYILTIVHDHAYTFADPPDFLFNSPLALSLYANVISDRDEVLNRGESMALGANRCYFRYGHGGHLQSTHIQARRP